MAHSTWPLGKPLCPYGDKCYRKNRQHLQDAAHSAAHFLKLAKEYSWESRHGPLFELLIATGIEWDKCQLCRTREQLLGILQATLDGDILALDEIVTAAAAEAEAEDAPSAEALVIELTEGSASLPVAAAPVAVSLVAAEPVAEAPVAAAPVAESPLTAAPVTESSLAAEPVAAANVGAVPSISLLSIPSAETSLASRMAQRRQLSARRRSEGHPKSPTLPFGGAPARDAMPRPGAGVGGAAGFREISSAFSNPNAPPPKPGGGAGPSAFAASTASKPALELPEVYRLASADEPARLEELLRSDSGAAEFVNFQDPKKYTPLIEACRRSQGGYKCALLLIRHGADVNLTNGNGTTPLMWAAHHNNSPCVELLLQKGALTGIRATSGPWKTDTALIVAKKNIDNARCIRLIENAEKKEAEKAAAEAAANAANAATPRHRNGSSDNRVQDSVWSNEAELHADAEEELLREVKRAEDARRREAQAAAEERAHLLRRQAEMEAEFRRKQEEFEAQTRAQLLATSHHATEMQRARADAEAAKRFALPAFWTQGQASTESTGGYTLVPLTADKSSELAALGDLLTTPHPEWLGIGRDVQSRGRYTKLKLQCAWRLENPAKWMEYAAARERIRGEMSVLRKAKRLETARPENYRAQTSVSCSHLEDLYGGVPTDAEVHETVLMHGTKAEILPSICALGFNEKYSGANVGKSKFGEGSYFAEDVGKSDQYVSPGGDGWLYKDGKEVRYVLPPVWREAKAPAPDGRTFYWYKTKDGTKKSQWERPMEPAPPEVLVEMLAAKFPTYDKEVLAVILDTCSNNFEAAMHQLHQMSGTAAPAALRRSATFGGNALNQAIEASAVETAIETDARATDAGVIAVQRPTDANLFYVFVCRVCLGHSVRTLDGVTACDENDEPSIWAIKEKELARVPGVPATTPVHFHSLLADTGDKLLGALLERYREFVLFNPRQAYPDYVIAYSREMEQLYPLGAKVYVLRSSGEESVAFVTNFDAATGIYVVDFDHVGSQKRKKYRDFEMSECSRRTSANM